MSEGLPRGFGEVVRGSVWLVLSGVVVNLAGIVFWLVSSRFAGAYGIGYAATAVSIAMLVSGLANLGLSYSMLREIPVRGSRAFSSGLVIASALGAVGWASITPLAGLYGGFSEFLAIAGAMILLSMASTVAMSSLIASGMARHYFVSNLLGSAARLAVGLPLVLRGFGGYGASIGMLSSVATSAAYSLTASARAIGLSRPGPGDLSAVLRVGASNYPQSLFASLASSGVLVAGAVSGDPGAAGAMYICLMIVMAIGLIPSSLASLSLPAMMRGAPREVSTASAELSIALTIPIAAGIGISAKSVLGILGEGFSEYWEALSILSLAAVPWALTANALARINRDGELKRAASIGLASLATLAVLSQPLARALGVEGVAIAYLAAVLAPLPLLREPSTPRVLKALAVQAIVTAALATTPKGLDIYAAVAGSAAATALAHITGSARLGIARQALKHLASQYLKTR